MQLICNSCLSLHLYSDIYCIEYNNPFVGCVWNPATMIKFVKYYKKIDYTNINLSFSDIDEPHFYHIFHYPHIICNIDNLLTLHYVHSYEFCENNVDEFKDTYFRRLERFNINEDPIFILGYGFAYAECYCYNYDYNSCIKFNFLNAKTIQLSNSVKYLPVGHNYNKFMYVKSVIPIEVIENNEKELKDTIEELLKC